MEIPEPFSGDHFALHLCFTLYTYFVCILSCPLHSNDTAYCNDIMCKHNLKHRALQIPNINNLDGIKPIKLLSAATNTMLFPAFIKMFHIKELTVTDIKFIPWKMKAFAHRINLLPVVDYNFGWLNFWAVNSNEILKWNNVGDLKISLFYWHDAHAVVETQVAGKASYYISVVYVIKSDHLYIYIIFCGFILWKSCNKHEVNWVSLTCTAYRSVKSI